MLGVRVCNKIPEFYQLNYAHLYDFIFAVEIWLRSDIPHSTIDPEECISGDRKTEFKSKYESTVNTTTHADKKLRTSVPKLHSHNTIDGNKSKPKRKETTK